MVSKVPKFQVSSHKQQRNAFDLSQSHLIQAAPGQLLPVLTLDCIVDDDITINVNDFVKSMPIVNAPFCDARGVYEFFFVPYHQLWHNFDQFITQMNDYRSSTFALDNPPDSIPHLGTVGSSDGTGSDTLRFRLSPRDLQISGFLGTLDIAGLSRKAGVCYLSDLLGYGHIMDGAGNVPSYPLPSFQINPFRFAAYNKIYQDYYRKTAYEAFNVNSYSLDDESLNTVPWSNPAVSNSLVSTIQMHYRNYGLDLLTNVRPSASLNVNNQSVFTNIIPRNFGLFDEVLTQHIGSVRPDSESTNNIDGVQINQQTNNVLNVQSIRAAFALDKLSQLIGRAEKDFKSQMRAVYGTDVSEGRDGKAIFIGGFNSDISFGDIDNTNGASYSSKYSSYGKVFGKGNGSIHFKCPEFGILMCIYSIIPFVPYDSDYIDAFNTKRQYSDYFNPLYQHLGLQPLYRSQITYRMSDADTTNNSMFAPIGWQPRYSEYKTAVDRNHGSFCADGSLKSFTASRSRGRQYTGSDTHTYWLNGLHLADFKISPNIFDSVFTVNVGDYTDSYPFMNKISFNIIKVSSMDTDSLPLL